MARAEIWSRFRKLVAMVIVSTLVVSGLVPIPGVGVPKAYAHWADQYLQSLVSQGVMRGEGNGQLYPDRNITRAEFAVMINQACGFTKKGTTRFSDVPANEWYADAMGVASYQGFMKGTGNGTASPTAALTREEAVTMLCQALKLPEESENALAFKDNKKFSAWSRGYINAAVSRNILSGYPDNTFRPQNPITRGEAARILDGLVGTIVRSGGKSYLGYVHGNVTLTKSGSSLRNTTITGDLYITEGVDTGYIFLENVTVLGDIIISGGGQSNQSDNSIVLDDCDVKNIIVNLNHDKVLSLIAQGNTDIENVIVKSSAFLAENNSRGDAFQNVDVMGPKNCTVNLSGDFEQVRLMGIENVLRLNKGEIDKLIADEDGQKGTIFLEKETYTDELYIDAPVKVTGKGTIDYLSVGVSGSTVEQVPNEIYIRPGCTITINGKEMGYLEGEAENLYPRVQSGYPEIDDVTVNTAKGFIKGNKLGTVYWMLKEEGERAPTEDELRKPSTANDTVLASGNAKLADVDKEITASLSNMKTGKSYELYAMLVDSKNETSRIRSESFETLDKTAPKFIAGYPIGEAVYQKEEKATDGSITRSGDHQISFEAVADKDCTVYWSALPAGSVAPTASNLVNGKAPGQIKNGSSRLKINELGRFVAEGLAEKTNYDMYLVLRDDKGNTSAVAKKTIMTLDVTAPDFIPPYPMKGTVADKSVEHRYMTTENATLYWAVYKPGVSFPPGYTGGKEEMVTGGGMVTSAKWTTAAENAVITGNGSTAKGSVQASASKEGGFTVTGLEPQTTYTIYMVLEDGTGNRRLLGPWDMITKDDVNPTAKMKFDPSNLSDEGYPRVGSEIRVAFSEMVYAGGETERVKLSALATMPEAKTGLADYISFYSIVPNEDDKKIDINFDAVTFDETNGKTEVCFSTSGTSTGAALTINNGADYYFVLSKKLIDMTGNVLGTVPGSNQSSQPSAVRMESFRTMAPFISLREISSVAGHDLEFDMNPRITGADANLLFDLILESDHKIEFKLLTQEDSEGKPKKELWEPVSGGAIYTLLPGQFFSLEFLKKGAYPESDEFTVFNDLKRTQYAIKIISMDDNGDSTTWNTPVNVTVHGVAGMYKGMRLASYGTGSFEEFIKDGKLSEAGAAVVSDPSKIICNVPFSDATSPRVESFIVLPPGAVSVNVEAKTNKACTLFWVIAPQNTIRSTPTAIQMRQGMNLTGGQSGSFPIQYSNAPVTHTIKKLKPGEVYDIYYMAGASVPTAGETVARDQVAMNQPLAPQFATGYPNVYSTAKGDEVRTAFDGDLADVYWAAFPAGTVESITGAEVMAGKVGGTPAVSTGQRLSLQAGDVYSFICNNLQSGLEYDCFIVAQNSVEAGTWCEPEKVAVSLKDSLPPGIESISTAITATTGAITRYQGSVTISFTEPLYYSSDTSSTKEWKPFTLDQAKDTSLRSDGGGVRVTSIRGNSPNKDGALKTMVINFDMAPTGSVIIYDPYFADEAKNVAGYGLYLKFTADLAGNASWSAYFQQKN